MRIAVLGGGPGGLFAATLAKTSDPSREVTVFERNRAEDTFGFGVVFSDCHAGGIDEADPVLRDALTEHGVHWDPIEVRLQGRAVPLRRQRDGGRGAEDAAPSAAAAGRRGRRRPALLDRGRPGRPARRRVRPGGRRRRGQLPAARPVRGRVRTLGRDGDGQVHLAGHHVPLRGADLRPRARPARRLRGARLSDRRRRVHIHRRDRRGVLARGGARRVRRHPARRRRATRRAGRIWRQLFAEQIDGHRLLVNNSRWGNFRTRRADGGTTGSGGNGDRACSATPRTPPTSRSAPARRWPWRTPSRSWQRSTQHGDDVDAALADVRGRPGSRRSRRSRIRLARASRGGSTSAGATTPSRRGSSPTTSSPVPHRVGCAAATRVRRQPREAQWIAEHGSPRWRGRWRPR